MLFFSFILSIFATVLSGGHRYFKLIFFSMLETNWFDYATDKCGWCQEELLPWWQTSSVAWRVGASELIAWYSCCREPWPHGAVNLLSSLTLTFVKFPTVWLVQDFKWRIWDSSCWYTKVFFSSYYYHALVNSCSADCDRCSEVWLVIRLLYLWLEIND